MAGHPVFSEDMREIVESFVIETQELFEDLNNDLLRLAEADDRAPIIDKIFRAVHTVKGTSGFLSLEQLTVVAHGFENLLNRLRRGHLDFEPAMMETMFSASDQMKRLMQQVLDGQIEPLPLDDLLANLDRAAAGGHTSAAETGAKADAASGTEKSADVSSSEKAAREIVEEALRGTDRSADAARRNPPKADTKTSAGGPAAVPSAADLFLQAGSDAADASSADFGRGRVGAAESIRVQVDRLDELLNLVGELVLNRNRLLQVIERASAEQATAEELQQLAETGAHLDFLTAELQSSVMRTRMVQIGRVFNRFPRVVHDLARELGKEVELEIHGTETELDKNLVEEIGDPLLHLIRNAVDHGIESPDRRRSGGKSARGKIRLAARHEGNHILITLEDDGKGINLEEVRKRAVERGLLSPEAAAALPPEQTLDLIFQPGLSTAVEVSRVSGRGVGMDVVRTNIGRLSGTIKIDSQPGRGTRFRLRLPLTLAIVQALLVEVGGERYALPLHAVAEVVATRDISTVAGRRVIRLRDEVVPLIELGHRLALQDGAPEGRYAVIIRLDKERYGLVVDNLHGQEEIVIKPLGTLLGGVTGLGGSTILGDGKVVMILDVDAIARGEFVSRMAPERRTSEAA